MVVQVLEHERPAVLGLGREKESSWTRQDSEAQPDCRKQNEPTPAASLLLHEQGEIITP